LLLSYPYESVYFISLDGLLSFF